MVNRFRLSCMALACMFVGACTPAQVATVVESLPKVVQYIQDAQLILDQIDAAAQPILALKADPELNKEYAKQLGSARSALQVAIRTTKGGQALSQGEIDAAFAEFKQAYTQLSSFLETSGLKVKGLMSSPDGGSVDIPTPLVVEGA
jgi:hypothetical protein